MPRGLTDANIEELSLVFAEKDGQLWAPRNRHARVLAVKGAPSFLDRLASLLGAKKADPEPEAESDYAADAVSVKGAKGVMQLMPETIGDYGVKDPFSAKQSILAGAKLLKALEDQYGGDRVLAAAAYNAGAGAVAQYGGVPPYVETQEYVAKVTTLYARYRQALGLPPRSVDLQPAQ